MKFLCISKVALPTGGAERWLSKLSQSVTRASKPSENQPDALSSCFWDTCVYTVADCNHGGTRTRNPQIRSLMRYPLRHAVNCVHPVGFEPTPPKRLGLKSNALDQLGHGYKWAAWNSSDDGGVRTHARRLVPKTSASGRSQELRPLGHIINVRDSDRVRTRIDLVKESILRPLRE